MRVLRFDGAFAPRVLKFDSGFADEGFSARAAAERLESEIGIEDRGAPDGAAGTGIEFGREELSVGGAVLSCIPVGACAFGAEGHMASIGPVGPWCQGLCSLSLRGQRPW